MPQHITHHAAYQTVDRDDFDSMIAVPRYAQRRSEFDEIISLTVDHFWDPGDPAYVDYDAKFDLEADTLMPMDFFPEFNCEVGDKLDAGDKIRLANELTRFTLSRSETGRTRASSNTRHLNLLRIAAPLIARTR